MKKIFIQLTILTIALQTHAQIKALTDQGKEVLLFDNGTWKYVSDSDNNKTDSISLNTSKFIKSPEATFLVKSNIFNIGVSLNPSQWIFTGHKDNEKNPEYNFSFKSGEAYAMLISETTSIDLEALRQIALLNAQRASSDIKETFAEYRIVNNKKVLCLEMKGTVKGLKIAYFGYYYSNDNGTVQLVSFASQSKFEKLKQDMTIFLNGLTEMQNK